ncbi:uncharacterized protein LOC122088847 [Macadamia integrifolia]|uniref:uncharacterized protein LOC122088847 n=1 Tax=Macadamia integrifolia TaxID=60698 RepID=UPI001C4E7B29|nr:uncharacterized protein LOC122088847 [Macadamia integrifolia]
MLRASSLDVCRDHLWSQLGDPSSSCSNFWDNDRYWPPGAQRICVTTLQYSVKTVFDAAIKVVLQPLKQKKKRIRRLRRAAPFCNMYVWNNKLVFLAGFEMNGLFIKQVVSFGIVC